MKNTVPEKAAQPLTQKYMDEMMRLYRERSPASEEYSPPADKSDNNDQPYNNDEYDVAVEDKPADIPHDDENYGTLVMEVGTANGDIPIEDAHVTVFVERNNEKHVIAFLITDKSGRTQAITLPAPSRELSMSPTDEKPYSNYFIFTTMDGFYPVINENVPVFSGIKSIQQISLVPLSEFDSYPDGDIIFDEEEPQDLQ